MFNPPTPIIIPPTSLPFLPTGLSPSYSSKYPASLSPYLEKPLFEETLLDINSTLGSFWPCLPLRAIAYLCCPCTLGISLLGPYLCIRDAEITVRRDIERFNELHEERRGVRMGLRKKCGRSWIEIEVMRGGTKGGRGEIEVPFLDNRNL